MLLEPLPVWMALVSSSSGVMAHSNTQMCLFTLLQVIYCLDSRRLQLRQACLCGAEERCSPSWCPENRRECGT